jgi:3D (Asp-Asp-Asp) domain-containing protein
MINYNTRKMMSFAFVVLAIGSFATIGVAPSAIAIEDLGEIEQIESGSNYEKWFDELEQILKGHGFEVVGEVNLESLEHGEELNIEIKEIIPHQHKKTAVDTLYVTEEKLLQAGRDGYNLFGLSVVVENDKISVREQNLVEAMQPVDEVIGFGTINTIEVDGAMREIEKVFIVEATAYTEMYPCTGKTPDHPYYGISATGVPIERGHIAVDPKVIPYFSEVYVQGLDSVGREYTGKYLATDTGGAIRGNKIDVYIGNYPEVYRFGRRNMKLFLLKEE